MRVSSNKILQKYDHPTSHYGVTLFSAQNLSDSNFSEAAYRLHTDRSLSSRPVNPSVDMICIATDCAKST